MSSGVTEARLPVGIRSLTSSLLSEDNHVSVTVSPFSGTPREPLSVRPQSRTPNTRDDRGIVMSAQRELGVTTENPGEVRSNGNTS